MGYCAATVTGKQTYPAPCLPVKSLRSPRHLLLLDKLRTLRKGAGITQVELAERLGRPQSYVAKIEGGERRMDVLEFIDWLEAVNAADQLQPLIQDLLAIRATANEDKR